MSNSIGINSAGIQSYDPATGSFSGYGTTQYNFLMGGPNNSIISLSPSTSGSVPMSNGPNSAPTMQVITPALTPYFVTSSSQVMASNMLYIINNNTLKLPLTIPTNLSPGNVIKIVCGQSANQTSPWSIIQAAGMQIIAGNKTSTLGATGTLFALNANCSVELVCLTGGSSAVLSIIGSYMNYDVT